MRAGNPLDAISRVLKWAKAACSPQSDLAQDIKCANAAITDREWVIIPRSALERAQQLSCGQVNDTPYDIKQRLDDTHRFLNDIEETTIL